MFLAQSRRIPFNKLITAVSPKQEWLKVKAKMCPKLVQERNIARCISIENYMESNKHSKKCLCKPIMTRTVVSFNAKPLQSYVKLSESSEAVQ